MDSRYCYISGRVTPLRETCLICSAWRPEKSASAGWHNHLLRVGNEASRSEREKRLHRKAGMRQPDKVTGAEPIHCQHHGAEAGQAMGVSCRAEIQSYNYITRAIYLNVNNCANRKTKKERK